MSASTSASRLIVAFEASYSGKNLASSVIGNNSEPSPPAEGNKISPSVSPAFIASKLAIEI